MWLDDCPQTPQEVWRQRECIRFQQDRFFHDAAIVVTVPALHRRLISVHCAVRCQLHVQVRSNEPQLTSHITHGFCLRGLFLQSPCWKPNWFPYEDSWSWFFYTQDTPPFGALTLSIGWQEGHPACKLISTPASSFCTILVTNIHTYKQSENNNLAGKDSLQLSQVNLCRTQKTARFSKLRPTFHCILSIFPDHFQISTTGGSYASGENATF